MLRYRVTIEPQKEGGYTVTVPALRGCVSEGNTVEKALANITEAIEGYIHVLVKHKRSIPVEVAQEVSINVFAKSAGR